MHFDIDTEALGEGALLIGVGMAVVFAALAILMVSIMIINRLAPEKSKKVERTPLLEAIETERLERERVAALAVAVAKSLESEGEYALQQKMTIPAGWAGESSRWAVSGREQVMRSRGKAGRQWGRRSD